MGLLLPRIGITGCDRAESLLRNHSTNIVGTFWIMNRYGFDEPNIPDWWTDNVLEDNQAQGIIDAYDRGYFSGEHDNPLYLGFCIIVVADNNNPANLSYVIQHLRMLEYEGIGLLKILAEHNIPAHTEVTYPMFFLRQRYGQKEEYIPTNLKKLDGWSVQLWEDYCSYLMAEHGQDMTAEYWSK